MALGGLAQKANIKRCLEEYLVDNLRDAEGLQLDLEGVPFETTGKGEWAQPRVIDFTGVNLRQASATEYGTQVSLLLNINIFVPKSGTTYADRHYRLRDKVVNYFKVGQKIPVRDYIGGGTTPVIDYMKVRRVATDRPVFSEDFLQYSLAFDIDYTERTINA